MANVFENTPEIKNSLLQEIKEASAAHDYEMTIEENEIAEALVGLLLETELMFISPELTPSVGSTGNESVLTKLQAIRKISELADIFLPELKVDFGPNERGKIEEFNI